MPSKEILSRRYLQLLENTRCPNSERADLYQEARLALLEHRNVAAAIKDFIKDRTKYVTNKIGLKCSRPDNDRSHGRKSLGKHTLGVQRPHTRIRCHVPFRILRDNRDLFFDLIIDELYDDLTNDPHEIAAKWRAALTEARQRAGQTINQSR